MISMRSSLLARSNGASSKPNYAHRLLASLDQLIDNPQLGPPADQISDNLRRKSFGSHVAYYRLIGDDIVITRIVHASRDVKRHLR